MKIGIAAITVAFLLFTPMLVAYTGFYGTVYKGDGTEEPAGYASVKFTASGENRTVGCNAQGQYGIQDLDGNKTYYLYAWKVYEPYKYTDALYRYCGAGQYLHQDFHIHPGEPMKQGE
jgi:hypothetical protein